MDAGTRPRTKGRDGRWRGLRVNHSGRLRYRRKEALLRAVGRLRRRHEGLGRREHRTRVQGMDVRRQRGNRTLLKVIVEVTMGSAVLEGMYHSILVL